MICAVPSPTPPITSVVPDNFETVMVVELAIDFTFANILEFVDK